MDANENMKHSSQWDEARMERRRRRMDRDNPTKRFQLSIKPPGSKRDDVLTLHPTMEDAETPRATWFR
jgi:hypothetical protein